MATSENQLLEVSKLQKIARMQMADIPQKQIAIACGVSESRISQILQLEEYKAEEEKVVAENFEENELINRGWDGVEAVSVKRVIDHLNADPDPDFALRAANVANRAIRRGGNKNNPISQKAGLRSVIQLSNTFIEKLQQNLEIGKQHDSNLLTQKKGSDFMGAKAVQDLLQSPIVKEEDLLPELQNMIG